MDSVCALRRVSEQEGWSRFALHMEGPLSVRCRAKIKAKANNGALSVTELVFAKRRARTRARERKHVCPVAGVDYAKCHARTKGSRKLFVSIVVVAHSAPPLV